MGRQAVRKVPVDERYCMRIDSLVQMIAEDRSQGVQDRMDVVSVFQQVAQSFKSYHVTPTPTSTVTAPTSTSTPKPSPSASR